MTECFTRTLKEFTKIEFDLVFLYATICEAYRRNFEPTPHAMFECVSSRKLLPDDAVNAEDVVNPEWKKYEWWEIKSFGEMDSWNFSEWTGANRDTNYILWLWLEEDSPRALRRWEVPGWFKKPLSL